MELRNFNLRTLCKNLEKHGAPQMYDAFIERYGTNDSKRIKAIMPQWKYLNEFEVPEWNNWWSIFYSNYNILPEEPMIFIIE